MIWFLMFRSSGLWQGLSTTTTYECDPGLQFCATIGLQLDVVAENEDQQSQVKWPMWPVDRTISSYESVTKRFRLPRALKFHTPSCRNHFALGCVTLTWGTQKVQNNFNEVQTNNGKFGFILSLKKVWNNIIDKSRNVRASNSEIVLI